mmetsp:Transcript_6974/g.14195  ORF Transcript_6974/g.14195 Transcript_6974/m.14195 type:complete len:257 (-) Transcript_6974:1253-2023(-)
MNSCHRIVVSVFFTLIALKMSSTSSSVRAPRDPAPAFVTNTCFRESSEISPDPSVSRVSNSFLRSLICSGNRVKLSTSHKSFLMSENSLKLTRARTTFGFRVWSLSDFMRWAHSCNQARFCASIAVGRYLGFVTSSALINSLALRLTISQISSGSKSKAPLRMFARTTIRGSGPPHPPKGGSPLSKRKAMTPMAQMSHRSSYWPRITSGATVYGVPTACCWISPYWKCLLSPKSIILSSESGALLENKKFSSFRSL